MYGKRRSEEEEESIMKSSFTPLSHHRDHDRYHHRDGYNRDGHPRFHDGHHHYDGDEYIGDDSYIGI